MYTTADLVNTKLGGHISDSNSTLYSSGLITTAQLGPFLYVGAAPNTITQYLTVVSNYTHVPPYELTQLPVGNIASTQISSIATGLPSFSFTSCSTFPLS
jgi:hypothetical protein